MIPEEIDCLLNILNGSYGEILETHAMWECIASLGITPFKSGDMWSYIYGESPQDAIQGFGKTIFKAAWDFYTKVKTQEL